LQRIADIARAGWEAKTLRSGDAKRIENSVAGALRALEQYDRTAENDRGWSAQWRLRAYHKRLDLVERILDRIDTRGSSEPTIEIRQLLEKVRRYSPPIEDFDKRWKSTRTKQKR